MKSLWIVQIKMKGDYELLRINPYNPISYLFIIVFVFIQTIARIIVEIFADIPEEIRSMFNYS